MKVIDFETTADKFLISIDKNAMRKESVVRVVKRLRQEYLLSEESNIQATIQQEYKEENVEIYFSITSVYGIIIQIGADTLEGKSKIKVDGLDYFIYITKEQDNEISKYYRNPEKMIRFKIKQKKILTSGEIISAELINFSVPKNGNFIDALSALPPDTFSSFSE